MGADVSRTAAEGVAIALDGQARLAQARQSQAQVGMGLGKVGFKADRFLKDFGGLAPALLAEERQRELS